MGESRVDPEGETSVFHFSMRPAEEFRTHLQEGLRRLLGRRFLLAPLVIFIGLASAFLLWKTLERVYYEYWLLPRLKSVDGYSYPQLRYTVFDLVFIPWCINGLAACALSIRSMVSSSRISDGAYQSLLYYFALFAVLLGGGTLMLVMRSLGY